MFSLRGTKVAPQKNYYRSYSDKEEFYDVIQGALKDKGIKIEKNMSEDAILSLVLIYHLINNLNLYKIRRNRDMSELMPIQTVVTQMLDSIKDQTTKATVEMVIKEYVRYVLDNSNIPLPDYFKRDFTSVLSNSNVPSSSRSPSRSILSSIGSRFFTKPSRDGPYRIHP